MPGRSIVDAVPTVFDRVLVRALVKNPAQRYVAPLQS